MLEVLPQWQSFTLREPGVSGIRVGVYSPRKNSSLWLMFTTSGLQTSGTEGNKRSLGETVQDPTWLMYSKYTPPLHPHSREW